MRLDFLERLREKLNVIYLPNEIKSFGLNLVLETECATILLLPGGEEQKFMDGSRDKQHNLSVVMKHKSDRVCFDVLTDVYRLIENIRHLPSDNGSYEYIGSRTLNLPNKVGQDPKGLNLWSADFQITINIQKGVDI